MRKKILVYLVVCLTMILALQPLAQARSAAQSQTKTAAAGAPVPSVAGNVLGDSGGDASIMGSVGSEPGGSPGTWYIGATPPNVDYTKPVLLFVHGKGGWAGVWWQETVYHGTNDMYTYAYNNGYRTAFVDLHPNLSMWANGELLAQLINRVTAYYGVAQVDIVAHSKGGVDSDAAAYYYGANPKIRRVVTLGTPHWGTPIANMAYSDWTWWVAALMGELNEATYVMQTGYMEWFRSQVDETRTAPFYTLAGYKCGPVFTALWYSCAFIGGEDDGLVSVGSAQRPSSSHLKTGYWDHDEIRMGSRTWSWFSPVIRTASTGSSTVAVAGPTLAAAGPTADVGGAGKAQAFPGNAILRGGSTAKAAAKPFPVESGVRKATFTFLATSPDFVATLTGPGGVTATVTMQEQLGADNIFAGAWIGTVQVDAPAAGSWSIGATAAKETGYLMVAELDSNLTASLDVGRGVSAPGAARAMSVRISGREVAAGQAQAALTGKDRQVAARAEFSRAGDRLTATVAGRPGVNTVTVTVTGTLPDGTTFERVIVESFAAVAAGQQLR